MWSTWIEFYFDENKVGVLGKHPEYTWRLEVPVYDKKNLEDAVLTLLTMFYTARGI